MLLQEKLTSELVDEIERCNRLITLYKNMLKNDLTVICMQISIDSAKAAIKHNDALELIKSVQELKTYKL